MGSRRRIVWAVAAAVAVVAGGVAALAADDEPAPQSLSANAGLPVDAPSVESTTTSTVAPAVTSTTRAARTPTTARRTATTAAAARGPQRVTGPGLHVVSADGTQMRRLADMACQNGVMKVQWRHDSRAVVASATNIADIVEHYVDGTRRTFAAPRAPNGDLTRYAWDRSQGSDAFVYKWHDPSNGNQVRVSVSRGDFGGPRVDLPDVGESNVLGDAVMSPDGSLIALFRLDDHFRIYRSAGQLVHDWRPTAPATGWHAAWTSDSRYLITAGTGYWAIPVAGGAPRKLSDFSANMPWAISAGPGARFIAGATGNPDRQLAVIDADTGSNKAFPTPGTMISWRPGTDLIATDPFTQPGERRATIATFHADGRPADTLVQMDTVTVREGTHRFTLDRNAQMLRWSPDGRWLAFVAC